MLNLYPHSQSRVLDLKLFRNPTSEYRGAPFWSWNTRLDRKQLFRQIGYFQEMGFGGAHIHSRLGLETAYLGPEFMNLVRASTEEAKRRRMLTWLYDEDRWPSGFAGGLVTKDKKYRARLLVLTPTSYSERANRTNVLSNDSKRSGEGKLLGRYEVLLDDKGFLTSYRRLKKNEPAGEKSREWFAYLELQKPSSWFNNQTNVDTLNPIAIKRFIEVTHETYKGAVGRYFGKDVPAIFTDEPHPVYKRDSFDPFDQHDVLFPFTDDFFETYAAAYGGQRLEDHLPELIWDLPHAQASVVRYRYHDHVAGRFASAYSDTIGSWCEKNGIAMTGHMNGEHSLSSQTYGAAGEAMRSYRALHIPGIDVLWDYIEFTTAKQAQSACHQYGRPGVLSELYGVTGWHFDFVGHKRQGDWQAALGVTVRVPHLSWVSMAGPAKRDYPAAISQQSPWYQQYRIVEDHFARLNTVLTRGKPHVRIGVVHPIESFWLSCGASEPARLDRGHRETEFDQLPKWLLHGLLDFDFICESLLPSQSSRQTGSIFKVGEMSYDVVIVPGMRTIRSTTLDRLEAFAKSGGRVIFMGEIPSLLDGLPSDRARNLAVTVQTIAFNKSSLLNALEHYREVRIISQTEYGRIWRPDDSGPLFVHQLRVDGNTRYLFICNTNREKGEAGLKIVLNGAWSVCRLDTHTAKVEAVGANYTSGNTELEWDAAPHGSVLLELKSGRRRKGVSLRIPPLIEIGQLPDPVPVSLSEPNVLLLDLAEWRINSGPWQPRKEILKIDKSVRSHFKWPQRSEGMAQPWVDQKKAPVAGAVEFKFTIESEVEVEAPELALEEVAASSVFWNGEPVATKVTGFFTDEAIQKIFLPRITPGIHELIVKIQVTKKTNIEWMYLLGDFGVQVSGSRAKLAKPVRQLSWGSWVHQGLPFYAGNLTYNVPVEGLGKPFTVAIGQFAAPLITAALDGKSVGSIAFAPFRITVPAFRGKKTLSLTVYGNRANAFGCIHNPDKQLGEGGYGPDAWYGPDAMYGAATNWWAYEYQLRPMGILAAPIIGKC